MTWYVTEGRTYFKGHFILSSLQVKSVPHVYTDKTIDKYEIEA